MRGKALNHERTDDNKTSKCVRHIGILILCLVTQNNKIWFSFKYIGKLEIRL